MAEKLEATEVKDGKLEWRCLNCEFKAPPDGKGYSNALLHKCSSGEKKKIRLVDISTGEELASNVPQAQRLGLVPKKQIPSSGETTTTSKMETKLSEGESVTGIVEHPGEGERARVEGVSDELIEGEALWVKAQISVKTLLYYQLIASKMRKERGEDLSMGTFFDAVSDDYFKGRNLNLELVPIGKK